LTVFAIWYYVTGLPTPTPVQREAAKGLLEQQAGETRRDEAEKQRILANRSRLVWKFQNIYGNTVEVAFYSKTRAVTWPAVGDARLSAWLIASGAVETFSLECQPGELICFGAWVRGNDRAVWGVGPRSLRGCTACCYTCGSDTRPTILPE
jgi:hypothetical protein